MNIDHIHDALNLLDDDLIETVEKLRNEKTHIIKMNRKNTWIRWVSIAACLCLVVVSVYVTNGFGLMSYKGASNNSAKEETASETYDNDDMEEIAGIGQIENPSVLVEIVSWGENGFTGTVTGIVDTEKYPVGTTVTVKFNDDIHIKVSSENGTTYKGYIPDSTDFSVGSIVCVQFDKSDSETNEVILYAETITFSDSE